MIVSEAARKVIKAIKNQPYDIRMQFLCGAKCYNQREILLLFSHEILRLTEENRELASLVRRQSNGNS